jgi:hypothetical protein
LLFVAGYGRGRRSRNCVFCAAEGEYEAEGIFAVQIEAVETFLRDKAERGVQREGGRIIKLGLESDLSEKSQT